MNKTFNAILLPILFLISLCSSVNAQQIPLIQAYSFQPKILNPAAQGGASGGGILALYRNQFSDLPTSARPVTYLLQADVSPLIHDRIGVGLLAMQDKAALTKRTTVNAYFAYHLFPEQSPFRLSLGANAGILSQNMDLTTATVNNPNDLVLVNGMQSKTQFDGGVGLQLQYVQNNGSRLQLDASMPQLFTSNLSFSADGNATNNLKYDVLPHAFASLLYRWQTSPFFALEPNVVYRESYSTGTAGGNVDLNLRLFFWKTTASWSAAATGWMSMVCISNWASNPSKTCKFLAPSKTTTRWGVRSKWASSTSLAVSAEAAGGASQAPKKTP
ncbi:MAG: PorP/SprF family type IX secretion system membrane protein [Lewinellaceae bacterium]|nr:PorP/SprF family type IX secretion system membrane protein [Lewinellaceae bacterium]